MKHKKILAIVLSSLVLVAVAIGLYVFFIMEDKNSTLTMAEKQWIEENKNDIIDLGFINNIPIFNFNGEGLFFDFIKDLESTTGLEFNKLSYSLTGTTTYDYALKIKNEVEKNDILIYKDNYSLVSKNNIKYNRLSEIEELTVGVLKEDLDEITYYLSSNEKIKVSSYESIDLMISDTLNDKINAFILPKTLYLNKIIDNKLNINYNIVEKSKNIVLSLGNNDKLNVIIQKYFKKWNEEEYSLSFNNYFTRYYLNQNKISEDLQVKFASKQYKYGFVELAPFDKIVNGKLYGINKEILKQFGELAGIEIKYVSPYDNSEKLVKAFNENKIDIFFNNTSFDKYDMDTVNTVSISDELITILSKNNQNHIINSLNSLKNSGVSTVKNSKISSELKELDIKVKEYSSFDSLVKNSKDSEILLLDKYTYNTYDTNRLEEYTEIYSYNLKGDYNYTIRDISENEVFINYFNFYLSFTNEKELINLVDYSIFTMAENEVFITYIILGLALFIVLFVIYNKKFKKTKKPNKVVQSISKESKLRYIDMLTSLKNRNYLNDSIEKWDDTEIYPQAIVIVDLNNVAYINDNYGHTEGDNVIKEAANVLIKSQMERTEIIRTNGNEFLIYLVEYDEKQVSAYIKKLFKDFKELSHGFGAALGYSMITDGLKTIDDAINEATLDMRTNKEEVNN